MARPFVTPFVRIAGRDVLATQLNRMLESGERNDYDVVCANLDDLASALTVLGERGSMVVYAPFLVFPVDLDGADDVDAGTLLDRALAACEAADLARVRRLRLEVTTWLDTFDWLARLPNLGRLKIVANGEGGRFGLRCGARLDGLAAAEPPSLRHLSWTYNWADVAFNGELPAGLETVEADCVLDFSRVRDSLRALEWSHCDWDLVDAPVHRLEHLRVGIEDMSEDWWEDVEAAFRPLHAAPNLRVLCVHPLDAPADGYDGFDDLVAAAMHAAATMPRLECLCLSPHSVPVAKPNDYLVRHLGDAVIAAALNALRTARPDVLVVFDESDIPGAWPFLNM